MKNFLYSLIITSSILLLVISSSIIPMMKPSSISFFVPLRLLILFVLFVLSLAHTPPAPEQNKCLCPCPCHKATSSHAHNKSHGAHHKSHEAHNKSHDGSIATSPPAQDNSHEAYNKNHEATSPPKQKKNHDAHNKNHEATSPPKQNKNHDGSTSTTSPPTQDKSHEATSPPGEHNKSYHGSIATSPPAQDKSHEVTSPPEQNKSHDSSIATSPPAQDKSHEVTSPPEQNKSHDGSSSTTSPPAHSKSDQAQNQSPEATSAPAQNKGHEGSTLPSGSTSSSSYKGCFTQVFAFGESYTDRGNAFLLENNASSSANQQNQFCDGHLLIDFLCDALALPTLPSYKATSVNFTFGVNFAISGSTALPSSFFAKHFAHWTVSGSFWNGMPVENFQTQIDWFNKFRSQMGCKDENSCKDEMANALFWIGELGIDDYVRTHGLTLPHQWLAENSVAGVVRILHALLDSGARYIVVQGLPPIGCLPVDITACPLHSRDHLGCAPAANAAIKFHNEILQRELRRIRALHPQCTILYADYWSAYLTILENPAKYNFEEPFKACCGAGGDLNFNIQSLCGSPGTSKCQDPSKYISWDGIHLTQAMHRHIADLFINHDYCQPSFAELIKHKKET